MKTKNDNLEFAVYYKHGDCCGLGEHHDLLGCASGHKAEDYVLSAKFAYLTEAIDYAFLLNGRGVNAMLRKPLYGTKKADWSDYTLAKSPIRAKIVETRVG